MAILGQNELHVLLQKPDGTRAEPWIYKTMPNMSWYRRFYIADFNNDGADDIVFDMVKDTGEHAISIALSQRGHEPALVVRQLPMIEHTMQETYPSALLALDYNDDGNMDMVEIHGWKGEPWNAGNCEVNVSCPHVVVYPGDGRGGLGQQQYMRWDLPFGGGMQWPNSQNFFVQDIDMDGRDDVVFMNRSGYPEQTSLSYLKRNADGSVAFPTFLVDMGGIDAPAFFGDLNSDGRTDLIYGDRVHFRDASGAFQTPVGLGLRYYMDSYWNVLGDFDGNGQTDIVNRQFERFFTTPYFATYLQKNGTVQAPFFRYDPPTNHTVNPAKWDREAFTTGDFNGDGCLDIAVANQSDGILFVEGRNCMRPAS